MERCKKRAIRQTNTAIDTPLKTVSKTRSTKILPHVLIRTGFECGDFDKLGRSIPKKFRVSSLQFGPGVIVALTRLLSQIGPLGRRIFAKPSTTASRTALQFLVWLWDAEPQPLTLTIILVLVGVSRAYDFLALTSPV